jgi:multimeric flavodoxin WrbA
MMIERSFLFILGSARPEGNTELLARHAARSLPEDIRQVWLRLMDLHLPHFEDIRHHETRQYEIASENEATLMNATLDATDVVIASPVYWYSLSAGTKLYLDHWSGWMRLAGVEFRKRMASKTLWVVSVLSDDDSTTGAQPLVETLRLTAEYLQMNWGGVLLGYGNRPGDVLNDKGSVDRAEKFLAAVGSEVTR